MCQAELKNKMNVNSYQPFTEKGKATVLEEAGESWVLLIFAVISILGCELVLAHHQLAAVELSFVEKLDRFSGILLLLIKDSGEAALAAVATVWNVHANNFTSLKEVDISLVS
jgi:hypothetical protein